MENCIVFSKETIAQLFLKIPLPGQPTAENLKQSLDPEINPFTILQDAPETKPRPEFHRKETEIFYCFEGKATFVYGGELVDGHERQNADGTTNPNEWRGSSIKNGITVNVTAGDWVWVPAGQPHYHFTQTLARLLVIKIPVN